MAIIMKLPHLVICSMLWPFLISEVTSNRVPIVVVNRCPFTIWPATAPNTGHPIIANGGFCLRSEQSTVIHAPWDWSGRVWARTGCNFRASDINNTEKCTLTTQAPACQTGDCGGRLACDGLTGKPPATLVELTLRTDKNQPSFYDVSLVDGYNLPVSVLPDDSRAHPNCEIRGCLRDLKRICPLELQERDSRGNIVACKSACLAFDSDRFCCRKEYKKPENCKPSLYSSFFKSACPYYVSYAFDDSPSTLVGCLVRELRITFCPAGWGHTNSLQQQQQQKIASN